MGKLETSNDKSSCGTAEFGDCFILESSEEKKYFHFYRWKFFSNV
jgi:hypothetical protein